MAVCQKLGDPLNNATLLIQWDNMLKLSITHSVVIPAVLHKYKYLCDITATQPLHTAAALSLVCVWGGGTNIIWNFIFPDGKSITICHLSQAIHVGMWSTHKQ